MLATPLPECSLGWQVAHWIETLLCHGPGDVEGDPVTLDEDYFAAVVRAYGVSPEIGRRLVRRYILSRAKGRAKSEFAGMMACAEALGPVRFSHWAKRGETSWWGYEYEKGEPVGRQVVRPFIRCLATEELQTGNTYDNVHFMLTDPRSPITGEVAGIDAGLTRTFLPQGGEIRPSSASSASKDGGKETFAVLDETHLYVLPELRQMASTVFRNFGKRPDGMVLETTTMFERGAGSTAEETFTAVESGKLRRADIIFDHHEGPDPKTFDWEDDAQLVEALREAYRTNLEGPPETWVDLEAKVAVIRDPTSAKADSVRYFLNRSHSTETDVVDLATWDGFRVNGGLEPGDTILLGFDGSDSDDATGIVACRARDGLLVPVGLWEKPAGADADWRIPEPDVDRFVDFLFEEYRVALMWMDPARWQSWSAAWAERHGEKVVVDKPFSDRFWKDLTDLWDSTIRTTLGRLAQGEEPGSEHSMCHTGDLDLRRHIGNARRERIGGRVGAARGWKPAKKSDTRKKDLVDATMLALGARAFALEHGLLEAEIDEWVGAFTVGGTS